MKIRSNIFLKITGYLNNPFMSEVQRFFLRLKNFFQFFLVNINLLLHLKAFVKDW